jgi:hypothetical protein
MQLREPTEQEAAAIAAEAFFEPGAGEAARATEDAEESETPPQDETAGADRR